jgi:PAS domain S-box-containing protein
VTSPDTARQSLRSEEKFRLLVESVKDYGIFLLNPTGHVETWNTGAQRIKGYSADEIIGKSLSVFYTPEDIAAQRPQRLLKLALADGRVEDEGWRVRKDGTRFWADVVITPLRDATGTLQGFAKITRDLTARRESEESLRQSEERLRLMIASVQDYALYMLDPTGHVTSWNLGAERIKGYAASEIVGQHFAKFFPPEDIAAGKPERELELAARVGRFEDEAWRLRKDGSRFWTNVIITSVRNPSGELIGFTKVTRDLTERRKSEAERLRLAQAQEAIRLRDEFLSIASHELGTPLTALQLQLQVVLDQMTTMGVDQGLMKKMHRAASSGDRLADLIEALLDVSRIATGKLELRMEPFNLDEAVREVCERLQDLATLAGCTLTVSAPDPIPGTWDRLRVEQIVSNLVGNAIKYAAGTAIEVNAHPEGHTSVLTVSDRGPGLKAADLSRIFERFERASAQSYAGLGLGLYIVRQIAEAHGGTATASNRDGPGACFTVRLPLTRVA